jgi:two-component system KDP operon response regulator KdpE
MGGDYVLIVEDDPKMQRLLDAQLKIRGFEVCVVDNGEEALRRISDREPDVVLLDITLPGEDGLTVCRRLREWSAVPVILVTAADVPQTKVVALEQGADDYLTKPFHMEELTARIRAVLRRTRGAGVTAPATIDLGDLRIDLARREVRRGGDLLHLTKLEFDLLRELVHHVDKVVSYDALLQSVWGPGYTDVRPVHVHICNLRRKLEQGPTGPRHILAVPGVGYRFRV